MIIPPNFRGIACLLLAMGVFVSSDTCLKVAMQGLPMFELVVIRGIVAVAFCLLLALAMGDGAKLFTIFNRWVLARSSMEVISNFLFTVLIFRMPIADVIAIVMVAPLTTLVGARFLWGEHLSGLRIVLIVVGLLGALLVAQPGPSAASPYAMLGFLIAISVSARDLLSRKISADVPASIVALAIMLGTIMAGAAFSLAFETPTVPDIRIGGLAVVAAVLMVLGHMFAFLAFKIGPVRSVAPFMYSIMVWAGVLGYLVFGDVPNWIALGGMVLIVVAGLCIIATEKHPA